MSDEKLEQNGLSRRSFLGTAAASGAGIPVPVCWAWPVALTARVIKLLLLVLHLPRKAAAHSAEPGQTNFRSRSRRT